MQPNNSEKKDSALDKQPVPRASSPIGASTAIPARGAAPAQPENSRALDLADEIAARFLLAKVDYARPRRVKVTVPPDKIKAVALYVRDVLGFDHIEVVGGTDYPQQNEFEVIYFVGCVSNPGQEDIVLQIAERVKKDDAVVPSLVDVWTGTEYHERETFEMLGIRFEGHPDLRKILLPEDWNDIPPLRKDYTNPGH